LIDGVLEVLESPNGRSNRRTFWSCFVILAVGTLIYNFLLGLILGPESVPGGAITTRGVTYFVPLIPFGEPTGLIRVLFGYGSAGGIVFSVPLWVVQVLFALSAAVRRLRDCDKDCQWVTVFMLAPFSLYLAVAVMNRVPSLRGAPPIAASLVAIGLAVWGYVQLGVLPGTKGMNRFGAPPGAELAAPAEVFD
jgi:uncharacterized membrane protein YhaH (DUF805 family)